MAKLSLLLVFIQLTLVYSHPAGNLNHEVDLQERQIISTELDATTSFSTAILTLQSATITSRPAEQGVQFVESDEVFRAD